MALSLQAEADAAGAGGARGAGRAETQGTRGGGLPAASHVSSVLQQRSRVNSSLKQFCLARLARVPRARTVRIRHSDGAWLREHALATPARATSHAGLRHHPRT